MCSEIMQANTRRPENKLKPVLSPQCYVSHSLSSLFLPDHLHVPCPKLFLTWYQQLLFHVNDFC